MDTNKEQQASINTELQQSTALYEKRRTIKHKQNNHDTTITKTTNNKTRQQTQIN